RPDRSRPRLHNPGRGGARRRAESGVRRLRGHGRRPHARGPRGLPVGAGRIDQRAQARPGRVGRREVAPSPGRDPGGSGQLRTHRRPRSGTQRFGYRAGRAASARGAARRNTDLGPRRGRRVRPTCDTAEHRSRRERGRFRSMIPVLVVDDEPMVCAHLRTILDSAEDIEVVGEARDGAEAVESVLGLRPRVVLMDLRMPGVDGIVAIERIGALAESPAVVALTTFDDDTHVVRALSAGAIGFLVKTTPAEDLINLVRVAADGHTVMSPEITHRLLGASAGDRSRAESARRRVAVLSDREHDLLGCLGQGMSNADIAGRLFLSEATVKSYVSRMLTKLDCANRTQAGLLAHEAGVVAPPTRE